MIGLGLCGRSPLLSWVGCRSPSLGLCAGASQPLIRLRNHPRFQVWAPSWGFMCVRPPRHFLSVRPGSRTAYEGIRPPRVSGVGSRPLIVVHVHWGTLGLAPRQLGPLSGLALSRSFSCGPPVRQSGCMPAGLQVSTGAAFPHSQSRGRGGRGVRAGGCCGEFSN